MTGSYNVSATGRATGTVSQPVFGSNNIVFYVISSAAVAVMGTDAPLHAGRHGQLPASIGQGVGCPQTGPPQPNLRNSNRAAGPLSPGPACHCLNFT